MRVMLVFLVVSGCQIQFPGLLDAGADPTCATSRDEDAGPPDCAVQAAPDLMAVTAHDLQTRVPCASLLPLVEDCFVRFKDPAARGQCYAPIVAEGGGPGSKIDWITRCVAINCSKGTTPASACRDARCNGPTPGISCCLAYDACASER